MPNVSHKFHWSRGTVIGTATGTAADAATVVQLARSNWHEGIGTKELALQLQLAL
jgi:hypothetical protein